MAVAWRQLTALPLVLLAVVAVVGTCLGCLCAWPTPAGTTEALAACSGFRRAPAGAAVPMESWQRRQRTRQVLPPPPKPP